MIPSSTSGDIFEGVDSNPIAFARVRGYQPESRRGLSLELGGPWAFYQEFWRAHNIEHLAQLLSLPEASIQPGEVLHVPLLIRNDTSDPAQVTLTSVLPQGWSEKASSVRYPVSPHGIYPVQATVAVSSAKAAEWQTVIFRAAAAGQTIGSITLRVNVVPGGLPQ